MKVWTKDEIKKNIEKSDAWLERGLVVIYNYQTTAERFLYETNEENGVGFNKFDAPFLSNLAQNVLRKWKLTDKQKNVARQAMLKYCGQLSKIANKEI